MTSDTTPIPRTSCARLCGVDGCIAADPQEVPALADRVAQARFDALLAGFADSQRIADQPRHAAQPNSLDQLMTQITTNAALSASVGVVVGIAISLTLALIARAVGL